MIIRWHAHVSTSTDTSASMLIPQSYVTCNARLNYMTTFTQACKHAPIHARSLLPCVIFCSPRSCTRPHTMQAQHPSALNENVYLCTCTCSETYTHAWAQHAYICSDCMRSIHIYSMHSVHSMHSMYYVHSMHAMCSVRSPTALAAMCALDCALQHSTQHTSTRQHDDVNMSKRTPPCSCFANTIASTVSATPLTAAPTFTAPSTTSRSFAISISAASVSPAVSVSQASPSPFSSAHRRGHGQAGARRQQKRASAAPHHCLWPRKWCGSAISCMKSGRLKVSPLACALIIKEWSCRPPRPWIMPIRSKGDDGTNVVENVRIQRNESF
jgi:hypothetical protein